MDSDRAQHLDCSTTGGAAPIHNTSQFLATSTALRNFSSSFVVHRSVDLTSFLPCLALNMFFALLYWYWNTMIVIVDSGELEMIPPYLQNKEVRLLNIPPRIATVCRDLRKVCTHNNFIHLSIHRRFARVAVHVNAQFRPQHRCSTPARTKIRRNGFG